MAGKQPKRKPRPGVDRYGRTPLHDATAEADIEAVRNLLVAGADPNVADDRGWSPLHFAAQAASVEATSLLLDAGADVHARDGHGNTPLSRAVFSSRGEGAVILRLLAGGADPDAANGSGITPLQLAQTIANFDIARFFPDRR